MPILKKASLAVGIALLAYVVPSHGMKERDLGPEYNELSFEVVTEHFDWAPLCEGGPLRLFSIGYSGHQRDTVELYQRFALDVSALYTEYFGFGCPPSGWGCVKGASEEERLARFRSII